MSAVKAVVWTCDRCGKRKDTPENEIPTGWQTVAVEPMGESPVGINRATYEVCDGCAANVLRYLQPTNKPDNGTTGKGASA